MPSPTGNPWSEPFPTAGNDGEPFSGPTPIALRVLRC